jgi:hypothetical protein
MGAWPPPRRMPCWLWPDVPVRHACRQRAGSSVWAGLPTASPPTPDSPYVCTPRERAPRHTLCTAVCVHRCGLSGVRTRHTGQHRLVVHVPVVCLRDCPHRHVVCACACVLARAGVGWCACARACAREHRQPCTRKLGRGAAGVCRSAPVFVWLCVYVPMHACWPVWVWHGVCALCVCLVCALCVCV